MSDNVTMTRYCRCVVTLTGSHLDPKLGNGPSSAGELSLTRWTTSWSTQQFKSLPFTNERGARLRTPHISPGCCLPFAQAYMSRKRRAEAPSSVSHLRARVCRALREGIGKLRFRPMYAGANMGHPSRTIDRGYKRNSVGFLLNLNEKGNRRSLHYAALRLR